MVLANPAKKASASLGTEGSIYFFLFIIVTVAILAIVFDPKQVAAIATPTGQSFFAPVLAFIHGIYDFIISFFTGILNKLLGGITSGASSIGSDIYNNTIGRL